MVKCRFVQIEPAEYLLDAEMSGFSAKEFGCYMYLILNLYNNSGKIEFDMKTLARLARCTRGFEKVWKKIGKHFHIRRKFLRHKRVTRDLARAKKLMQDKRRAGLASGAARREANKQRSNNVVTALQQSKVNERKEKKNRIRNSIYEIRVFFIIYFEIRLKDSNTNTTRQSD